MIIRSFFKRNEDRYRKRYTRFLPFLYETIFGYELFKGDSLTNFDNVGVSTSAPVQIGDIRTWKVESLISPYQGFEDCFSFDTPFFGGWKEGDAKEFSLLRKSTYKQSRKASTFLRDYVQPKLTFNLDRKIELSPLGRVVSDYQEAKLLIHHRMTTGRFTCGLDTNQMRLAIERYPLAPNPYKVYASGGYKVETPWRTHRPQSAEIEEINEFLSSSLDAVGMYKVPRINTYSIEQALDHPSVLSKRKVQEVKSFEKAKRLRESHHIDDKVSINRISFDMIFNGRTDDEVRKIGDFKGFTLTLDVPPLLQNVEEEMPYSLMDDDLDMFIDESDLE